MATSTRDGGAGPAGSQVVQRKAAKPKEAPAPSEAPSPASAAPSLNRTLYVVQNAVWSELPAEIRTSAEQELDRLFAFVGKAPEEKAYSIKVVSAAQLPEQLDFTESVVSLIRSSPADYVEQAFSRQRQQIEQWRQAHLAGAGSPQAQPATRGPGSSEPDPVGSGGGSKNVVSIDGQSFALHVTAGAVNLDDAVGSFISDSPSMLAELLEKLPERGRDLSRWPSVITSKSGKTSWEARKLLGQALGRAMAHEARHELVGHSHAAEGLGKAGAAITGSPSTQDFSPEDQKAVLDRIRALEKQGRNATVVPTYPQNLRTQPDAFPF